MNYTRRELGLILPALAAAQEKEKPMLPSKIYHYRDLPVKTSGENQSRAVFDGVNHSEIPFELHMTQLGPGMAPHPPHHHVHEECVMLKSGSLEVTISGNTTRVEAGSIIYVASGEEHGWKNPGTVPAEYFVIALGKKGT